MAMTKVELQSHKERYDACIAKARLEYRNGCYMQALQSGTSSWPYIAGMIQYERKYEERKSFTFEGLRIVFKLAPLLLDLESLSQLEVLLKNERRIVKSTPDDLLALLSEARDMLWNAHSLWDYLEGHGGVRQDELRRRLGRSQDQWRALAETWETMGLIVRIPDGSSYRLSLATQMETEIMGKCPACGAVAAAPKSLFLENAECPTCQSDVMFVLLSNASLPNL